MHQLGLLSAELVGKNSFLHHVDVNLMYRSFDLAMIPFQFLDQVRHALLPLI